MKSSQFPQPLNLLLAALLLVLCFYTALSSFKAIILVDGQYSTILLSKANYAGFVAAASCVLSYCFARRLFKRVLGIALLLAVFHVVNFLPAFFTISIGFGDVSVGLEPFFLMLLIGYYFLNRASANAFIRNYLLPAPTPEKAVQLYQESVDQFKKNFARKTDESLRQIVEERKLVPTAVVAAKELLSERKTTIAQARQ